MEKRKSRGLAKGLRGRKKSAREDDGEEVTLGQREKRSEREYEREDGRGREREKERRETHRKELVGEISGSKKGRR